MTFWDWLATGPGIEAEHATIALLIAITGILQLAIRSAQKRNSRMLREHWDWHARNTPAARHMKEEDHAPD